MVAALERCLARVHEAEITASQFHPDNQLLLFERMYARRRNVSHQPEGWQPGRPTAVTF